MHSLQPLPFKTLIPLHLKGRQNKTPSSCKAHTWVPAAGPGTGCWHSACRGLVVGNASRSISPRWKGRQGQTAGSYDSIETVKKIITLGLFEAEGNAVGILPVFSWWEGEFFAISLVSSSSVAWNETFHLFYLCFLKHQGRALVWSCLGTTFPAPWMRHIKQCLAAPWDKQGRTEGLRTPWGAPLTSWSVSSLWLLRFHPPWEGQKVGRSQLGLDQLGQGWEYSNGSSINPPALSSVLRKETERITLLFFTPEMSFYL